jgi:hypothetical protein
MGNVNWKVQKRRKLPTMTQLIAKLREKEMKSVGVMKRGPIGNRDNFPSFLSLFVFGVH